MKKILLIVTCCFLVSCHSTKVVESRSVIFDNTYIEETEEAIEDVEGSKLDEIINELNQRLRIVEIELHHNFLSEELLATLNKGQTLEYQEEGIKVIVREYLESWKLEKLNELLKEENITINEYDLQDILDQTSIKSIYTLMLAYEKVFLERSFK